jgi:hypothetical protein
MYGIQEYYLPCYVLVIYKNLLGFNQMYKWVLKIKIVFAWYHSINIRLYLVDFI